MDLTAALRDTSSALTKARCQLIERALELTMLEAGLWDGNPDTKAQAASEADGRVVVASHRHGPTAVHLDGRPTFEVGVDDADDHSIRVVMRRAGG